MDDQDKQEKINLARTIVHFVRKPARSGRTYMFVIPAEHVRLKYVDPAKTYRVYLEELSPEEAKQYEKKRGGTKEE